MVLTGVYGAYSVSPKVQKHGKPNCEICSCFCLLFLANLLTLHEMGIIDLRLSSDGEDDESAQQQKSRFLVLLCSQKHAVGTVK